jgi:hypothetical protein
MTIWKIMNMRKKTEDMSRERNLAVKRTSHEYK